jgi:hypothetical protein
MDAKRRNPKKNPATKTDISATKTLANQIIRIISTILFDLLFMYME